MVNYKTPGFYDNAHLHVCSICLRLFVSSLKEIQYLQIEPSEKGTHTNESLMLKTKCFICTDSSDEQSPFDGL